MQNSIWPATLASFRERVAGTDPVPAGVSAAAVAATLGLGLLTKVLEISRKRDPERVTPLIAAARAESERLTAVADEDIAVFHLYLDCIRRSRSPEEAMRQAIEVPIRAARAAVAGLGLCVQSLGVAKNLLAADLGSAAILLGAASRVFALSASSNLRELKADAEYCSGITAELADLEARAHKFEKAVLHGTSGPAAY